jgi:AcrR family transcriptional regulator
MATAGARRSAAGSVTPIERTGRTAATRQSLVQAAVAALQEEGFGGASARDIARRAGSTQSQVFYHFGTVNDLLLAALDDVSQRRMAVYAPLLAAVRTPLDLVETARAVVEADVAEGDLKVMVEMIAGATRVPGMGEQVAQRLEPWFVFAEAAVRKATTGLPFASLLPVRDLAHAVVAGILGLELLASLGGENNRTAGILDHLARLAGWIPPVRLPDVRGRR